MVTVRSELLTLEERLATGGAEAYRRLLAEDAVIVVPGAVMTRSECADAVEASPPWEEHTITDVRVSEIAEGGAVLTYRWRSRRGDQTYAAWMSSVYARRSGAWRLVHHQQTPEQD